MDRTFTHTFDSSAVPEDDVAAFDMLVETRKAELEQEHGIPLLMTGVEIGPGAAVTVRWIQIRH